MRFPAKQLLGYRTDTSEYRMKYFSTLRSYQVFIWSIFAWILPIISKLRSRENSIYTVHRTSSFSILFQYWSKLISILLKKSKRLQITNRMGAFMVTVA
jgi:hypothetical protein